MMPDCRRIVSYRPINSITDGSFFSDDEKMSFGTLFMVALFSVRECSATFSDDWADLRKYLQPMDVGRNPAYDSLLENDELCARDCTKYPQPRICYYEFIAEQYHAMGPACQNCPLNPDNCFGSQCVSADGVERSILTFNRQLPGPAINVCQGDEVIVDVHNKIPAQELTIHWHGILMQKSPWMDGVPFVTQCPIPDNTWFRYEFHASTTGSHFYHSHSGFQLFDGLSGAIIVRTADEVNPLKNHYDYDLLSHTIHIQDWLHHSMTSKFPGFNKKKELITAKPDSYLINGLGAYLDPENSQWTGTPFAEFHVKRNKRYRFRIVSVSSTTCSYQLTFEGHAMNLIATDGYPVHPTEVRTLYLSAGDTYDVVITTNQEPRPYWIRVQGVGGYCTAALQSAVLRYAESPQKLPPTLSTPDLFNSLPFIPEFNNIRKKCLKNADNLCLNELKSLYKAPDKLLEKPSERYIFHIGAHFFSPEELYESQSYHKHYLPESGPDVIYAGGMFADTLNNKTNIFPPFVLLSQPTNALIDEIKCPKTCDPWCECMHLIKLPYNKVIEMVFIDELSDDVLSMDHPMHIHGHRFTVMKMGTREDTKKSKSYAIDPNNKYPALKDSVPIPPNGFVVVRFLANNPGFWVLHCHFQNHNLVGMVVILQIGEPNEMLKPPADWPSCGNYLPSRKKVSWLVSLCRYFRNLLCLYGTLC